MEIGCRAVSQFPKSDVTIHRLFKHIAHEINTTASLAADEVVPIAELAEILRESPNMLKEGLLNRARAWSRQLPERGIGKILLKIKEVSYEKDPSDGRDYITPGTEA